MAEGVLSHSRLALAKAITAAENETAGYEDMLRRLYPHTGRALVIDVTGSPGSGKSTLAGQMARRCRQAHKTVGIIAVDPTSPFSGGAILGDRIRMNDLAADQHVATRSMGTRGSLGGLSDHTAAAVQLMDAFGMDVIFVETVGVGQSEVDIVHTADMILVTLVPGLGDDIQAIKAGILEIGDILIINKADREGADRLEAELSMMLDLDTSGGRRPPIVRTSASNGEGLDRLWLEMEQQQAYMKAEGRQARRRSVQVRHMLGNMVCRRLSRYLEDRLIDTEAFDQLAWQIQAREKDPYTAAHTLIEKLLREYKNI